MQTTHTSSTDLALVLGETDAEARRDIIDAFIDNRPSAVSP